MARYNYVFPLPSSFLPPSLPFSSSSVTPSSLPLFSPPFPSPFLPSLLYKSTQTSLCHFFQEFFDSDYNYYVK